ncbi:unnamed protein product [Blepharisma stoltei]|uniref:Uncharacterized protein n=1 Tax=Blepharisma stoltei TaxID=1481888 RepID=A0AAU9K686_9CILI|nr:unnamed protein product [Blepharisma stoltei]
MLDFSLSCNQCIDEVFTFTIIMSNYFLPFNFIFSTPFKIDTLLKNIKSSETLANVLSLAENSVLNESTLSIILSEIDLSLFEDTTILVNFFCGSKEILAHSFNYFKNELKKFGDNRSDVMVSIILEAFTFYTLNVDKKSAWDICINTSIDEFMQESEYFNDFKDGLKDLADAQLACACYSPDFLDAYFNCLTSVDSKSLSETKEYLPMFVLYLKKGSNKDISKNKVIAQYFCSLIDQIKYDIYSNEMEFMSFFKLHFHISQKSKKKLQSI